MGAGITWTVIIAERMRRAPPPQPSPASGGGSSLRLRELPRSPSALPSVLWTCRKTCSDSAVAPSPHAGEGWDGSVFGDQCQTVGSGVPTLAHAEGAAFFRRPPPQPSPRVRGRERSALAGVAAVAVCSSLCFVDLQENMQRFGCCPFPRTRGKAGMGVLSAISVSPATAVCPHWLMPEVRFFSGGPPPNPPRNRRREWSVLVGCNGVAMLAPG